MCTGHNDTSKRTYNYYTIMPVHPFICGVRLSYPSSDQPAHRSGRTDLKTPRRAYGADQPAKPLTPTVRDYPRICGSMSH